AVDGHLAAVGTAQQAGDGEQRRLPRARTPGHGDELARCDREGGAVQRDQPLGAVGEGDADLLEVQARCAAGERSGRHRSAPSEIAGSTPTRRRRATRLPAIPTRPRAAAEASTEPASNENGTPRPARPPSASPATVPPATATARTTAS